MDRLSGPATILIVFTILAFAGCAFDPPPFDNPVDPINRDGDPPVSEYSVGDIGPAGGWIFYVDEAGDFAEWTYLEAATVDLYDEVEDIYLWDESDPHPEIGGTLTVLGSGLENTQIIVAFLGVGQYAARAADEYEEGGFTDWFLPSLDEMEIMYANLDGAGDLVEDFGFFTSYYWTSSEIDADNAWAWNFDTNVSLDREKRTMGAFRMRPARRF